MLFFDLRVPDLTPRTNQTASPTGQQGNGRIRLCVFPVFVSFNPTKNASHGLRWELIVKIVIKKAGYLYILKMAK